MRRLLWDGLARMWKAPVFWGGALSISCSIIVVAVSNYFHMQDYLNAGYQFRYSSDPYLFAPLQMIGLFTALFTSLFLGTEYSSGTLRNKLIAGHGRLELYLSSLIVCFLSSLLACAFGFLTGCLSAIPLFGAPECSLPKILLLLAESVFAIGAFSALFTLPAMLISHKSSAVVMCILSIMLLTLCAISTANRLDEPKQTVSGSRISVSEDTGAISSQSIYEPNPRYLEDPKRAVYEFLLDFMPTGQCIQIASGYVLRPLRLALCSLSVIFAATLAGCCIFAGKDIR